MKKRILSMLMMMCMLVTAIAQSTTAQGFCVFSTAVGQKVVVGLELMGYTVGDRIDVRRLSLNYTPEEWWNEEYYAIFDGAKVWVDGKEMTEFYECTTVGEKKVTMKKGDLVAEASFQVKPKLNGYAQNLTEITLVTPPSKTTYRAQVEPFQADNIVVKCTFKDGVEQLLGHTELELYLVDRDKGVTSFSAVENQASPIEHGRIFVNPGEKDLIIRVANKTLRVPMSVQSATKGTLKTEMAAQPTKLTYVVGEGFHMSDYAVRCYNLDGSFVDYSGKNIQVTANGVALYEGYQFSTSGEKAIVVKFGDFKQRYTINVKAKTEVIKTPETWDVCCKG